MKKYVVFASLLLLVSLAAAQAVQRAEGGGTAQELINAIKESTKASKETQKEVEELYGYFDEKFQTSAGVIIVGISLWMVIEYLTLTIIDRVYKLRKKKSREMYIEELQNKMDAQTRKFVTMLKLHNKKMNETTEQAAKVIEMQQKFMEEIQIPSRVDKMRDRRNIAVGAILGAVSTYAMTIWVI
jgi:hypothetical protein